MSPTPPPPAYSSLLVTIYWALSIFDKTVFRAKMRELTAGINVFLGRKKLTGTISVIRFNLQLLSQSTTSEAAYYETAPENKVDAGPSQTGLITEADHPSDIFSRNPLKTGMVSTGFRADDEHS